MSAHPLVLLAAVVLAAAMPLASRGSEGKFEELRLETYVAPEFPASTRLEGQHQGIVTVAIGRDADGRVNDLLILDSTHARLTEAVHAAVSQWRFARPANQPSALGPVVPLVRFLFKAGGIAMVTPAAARATAPRSPDTAPVVLPTIADLDGDMTPVHQVFPRWRSRAGERPTAASVTVKYFIDEAGHVRVPVVLEASSPDLGEAALHAIAEWQYPPPRLAGRPAVAIDIQTFQFVEKEPDAGVAPKRN
jgi:TonB family protein